jgi:SAM-dependent methyltransferase
LEGLVEAKDLAWDCGAGSGQTARSLARRFRRVVGTDASLRQLSRAGPFAGVDLVCAAAEAAPLRDCCADLITVSAALHWFDRPRFYAEARRVARPGAILAVWSYYRSRIEPAIDAVLERLEDQLGSLWPPAFELNRTRYRDLELPFERLPWPQLEAEASMRMADLLQYVRTWSASQTWQRTRGTDVTDLFRADLERAWGDPQTERSVRWPLHGAMARLSQPERV